MIGLEIELSLPPFSYFLAGGLSLGYIMLLLTTFRNRVQIGTSQNWLIALLFTALLAQAIHIVHPRASEGPYAALFVAGITQPAIGVYLISLMLIVFGAYTFRYVQRSGALILLILGAAWWIAVIVAGFTVPNQAILGQAGWLVQAFRQPIDVPSLVAIGGWTVIGVLAFATAFTASASARLPEIGNRALFWVVVILLVMLGAVLGVSGDETLKQVGWIAQFVGLTGAVSGAISHRVFDIRRAARMGFSSILVTAVTAVMILAALLIARGFNPTGSGLILLIMLAIAVAILYVPVRAVMRGLADRTLGSPVEDSAQVARRYSQDIAGVVELDELVDVSMKTLRDALRVRRGCLMLATRDDDETLRVEPMYNGMGDLPADLRGWIPKNSGVYRTLYEQRTTLLQFDLEYNRQYTDSAPELLSFFRQLRMGAYAPIAVPGQLIGILAVGQKGNDEPFYTRDLEILATIANQTGISLRNARLVNDLRTASDSMQVLNVDLVKTKERLEKLDSVKSDFITVASHELRTPLAQIRGYTDIIETMNDQGILSADQVGSMTLNLRKATDRLERLIGDMLDVSQLDTDAMDLRFAQTTVENVMRLAIEPLTESIKQRKLTVMARHLHGLPPIQADMQRLVQAFRNVVLNAIKFTPDGGRIDITASLQNNTKSGSDEILIAIQDTGIGIDAKNQDLIFEKFFRVSDPGLHSTGATKFLGAGPGLGLTIARGVIQGHGGRIWVESPGYDPRELPGSTFFIILPVSPPEDAKRVMPFESGTTSASEPHRIGASV